MKENNLKQPFFATLLESQRKTSTEEEQRWPWPGPTTSPGNDPVTMKAPSDDDEIPPSM